MDRKRARPDDDLVGQTFHGVIESEFDGGILVKVDDIGGVQRKGVLFYQDKLSPVTQANGIAPDLKRKDIPISTGKTKKKPAEVNKEMPTVPPRPSRQIHRQSHDEKKIETPTVLRKQQYSAESQIGILEYLQRTQHPTAVIRHLGQKQRLKFEHGATSVGSEKPANVLDVQDPPLIEPNGNSFENSIIKETDFALKPKTMVEGETVPSTLVEHHRST